MIPKRVNLFVLYVFDSIRYKHNGDRKNHCLALLPFVMLIWMPQKSIEYEGFCNMIIYQITHFAVTKYEYFYVTGHYSVVEPDGSTRTVEYSAGPNTGFQAVVNTETDAFDSGETDRSSMESKAMRDYDRYYDFSEDADDEYYEKERKRPKRPYESTYNLNKKRPKYPSYSDIPLDSEASDYTHSITIKHPHDDTTDIEPLSHVGYSFDPNCKNKKRKESYGNKDNSYSNIVDLELNKKYPPFPVDSYRDTYDKYAEPTYDYDRYVKQYDGNRYKGHKYDDYNSKPSGPTKYTFPVIPDIPPPEKYYPDEFPTRPRKKRPYKHRDTEHRYPTIAENLNEYVLVPKKKLKKPTAESYDYRVTDDEYDHPHYSNGYDDGPQDDRYHSSAHDNGPKEVVRKIVKKRKPVVNILDMFDI